MAINMLLKSWILVLSQSSGAEVTRQEIESLYRT
jgi:hypothetical protein